MKRFPKLSEEHHEVFGSVLSEMLKKRGFKENDHYTQKCRKHFLTKNYGQVFHHAAKAGIKTDDLIAVITLLAG